MFYVKIGSSRTGELWLFSDLEPLYEGTSYYEMKPILKMDIACREDLAVIRKW